MNLVFGWCVERIKTEDRERWEAQLAEPLPGEEKAQPTQFQADQEADDFMATMAMHARVSQVT